MPSIIEVDTIKNKTGTQNTVLSTDGSGNNTLNAGVIKSNTGSNTGLTIASDGQVSITQNNPTVTVGSNATISKSGMVLQQIRIVDSSYTSNSTTSWNSIFTGIQITNVTSGSKVMIQACIAHLAEDSGQGAFRIIRASDSTDLGHSQHTSGGVSSWSGVMPTIIVEDTSPSAGTNNYTLQMRSSSPVIYYNYHNTQHIGTRSFFLLTELTQ